jgi:hypothetical protein
MAMTRELLIGVAAAVALSTPAFAQSAAGAPATTTAIPPAPSTTTGVVGITPPGVAGGVTPYRPAGATTNASGAATGSPLSTPLGPTPAPSGSYIANSINETLQAGAIPGSDSTTVGAASVGTGLRMPNPSTGTYNGAAGPTYGGAGATPYTGPGSVSVPAGAAPYTGPASLPSPVPAGGASGR